MDDDQKTSTVSEAQDKVNQPETGEEHEDLTMSELQDDVKESETGEEMKNNFVSVFKILMDSSLSLEKDPKNIARIEKKLAKVYSHGFPTPIMWNDLFEKQVYYSVINKKSYNWAILAFGVNNFFSYAAYFCKYEVQNNTTEIISIGSGDGTVDSSIIEAYHNHFGTKLNITLVDKNPDFKVDYKTVDDLLEKRPDVVRNCILFIIWPEPPGMNDNYDIEAIRKLQPIAALTAYELSEVSGSYDFVNFLRDRNNENHSRWYYEEDEDGRSNFGLDNYIVEEIARQEVYLLAGEKQMMFGSEHITKPGARTQSLRLVKVKRTD